FLMTIRFGCHHLATRTTIVYAQSWKAIWAMHEWVREFCRAHYFKINADKCRLIISDCRPNDPRWLYSVDGKACITPKGPDTIIRYLGVWISMNLDWRNSAKSSTKK